MNDILTSDEVQVRKILCLRVLELGANLTAELHKCSNNGFSCLKHGTSMTFSFITPH